MKNNLVIVFIVALIVGAGAFFGGMQYQKSKSAIGQMNGAGQGQRNGTRGNNNNRTGFRPVDGDIIAADAKSITVKLQDGSSKIVLLSDQTTFNKASSATRDDLKVGEKVAVFGQNNTDGSVNAQNIQLNPILRGMQNGSQPGVPNVGSN